MKYVVIKDKEVINCIEWDGITPLVYQFQYDNIEEANERQIGMKFIDNEWKYEVT